ncbi:MAG TPA: ADP-ribosylglycohydrolase family protein [Chloroflexota bacterium]|nr:ADP-ribosylglycohydrolase family protein [Chloroflexota bacterium]
MPLPPDYLERVYAGVLGKLIGVYLGRPFEGWNYERIVADLGEITGYMHERMGVPLVVTDDDITGTFTFIRALPDHGNTPEISAAQIGQTWLNYIIERRSILWWGGLGNSTEHTAYLRLKHGIAAPESGSIARNGQVVAEQIGAQIFIDGWAMVAPGDPEHAADLARRAASVSHDGEAVYGAQSLAAMEAQAFVEPDIPRLLDVALRVIPADSLIARLIHDIRDWHAGEPDWHVARERIATHYGYDTYGGGVHMIPNHALIVLGLLYGAGDFGRSLSIVNTSGWDTDCNSGNLGCLLGIRGGLAALEGSIDWRGPIADRLYLPTADPGYAITDAVRETYAIATIGRALTGEPPLAPKGGARFHFSLPGSVQGWQAQPGDAPLTLENVPTQGSAGERCLALHYRLQAGQIMRAATPTFTPPEALTFTHYALDAAPTIYSGQTLRARLAASSANRAPARSRLYLSVYGEGAAIERAPSPERGQLASDRKVTTDALRLLEGPEAVLAPGSTETITWHIPDTGGDPIAQVGVAIVGEGAEQGTVFLDALSWGGTPSVTFTRPAHRGTIWRRAWANAFDQYDERWPEAFRVVQNEGTGLLITGTRDWSDYTVSSTIVPHLVAACGLAARVQGLRRYYALVLAPGTARLVKMLDTETVLAEAQFGWSFDEAHTLRLTVSGPHIAAAIDGTTMFEITDTNQPLLDGGIALLCTEGRMTTNAVEVGPVES